MSKVPGALGSANMQHATPSHKPYKRNPALECSHNTKNCLLIKYLRDGRFCYMLKRSSKEETNLSQMWWIPLILALGK